MNVNRATGRRAYIDVRGAVPSMIRKADDSRGGKLVDIVVLVSQLRQDLARMLAQ